jgi:type I restriction enzyme, S subunit
MDLNLIQNNLPQSWALIELKDLVENPKKDIVDGPFGSNLKANEYTDSGVPVFKIQNIKANQFINKNINYIKKEKAKELHRHSFKSGDLIITKLGNPLGLCCKVPDKYNYGIIVADLMRFRPSIERVFDKYVIHAINSFFIQNQFKAITKGTTRPRVNLTIVRNIKVPYPPLPEQHRIVAKIEELFSELDNGIENLKKARQQLKTYRQAVLKYAFEGKLTKEWRAQQRQAGNPPEPAGKLLEQIKTEREKHYQKQLEDWKTSCVQAKAEGKKKPIKPKKPKELPPLTEKELAELPELLEGWGWVRIKEITTVLGDGLHGTPIYSDEGGYYFINGNNLSDGKIEIKENTKRVTIEEYEKYKKPLSENTVLVSINGTLGKTAFYNGERVILGKSACYFNVVNTIDKHYIRYCITSQRFINYAYKNATGSTIKNVSLKAMREFEIPIPPAFEEQYAIVSEIESRLSVCDKLEQTVEDSLKKAEALRQSILKKAFAGELTKDWREKHPELITGENSAEKLLEKIKAEKALAASRKKSRSKKMKKK